MTFDMHGNPEDHWNRFKGAGAMTFDMHGNPEDHWNRDLKVQCNDL